MGKAGLASRALHHTIYDSVWAHVQKNSTRKSKSAPPKKKHFAPRKVELPDLCQVLRVGLSCISFSTSAVISSSKELRRRRNHALPGHPPAHVCAESCVISVGSMCWIYWSRTGTDKNCQLRPLVWFQACWSHSPLWKAWLVAVEDCF